MLYWHLNPNDYENDEELRKIRETRGYDYMVRKKLESFTLFFFFFFWVIHTWHVKVYKVLNFFGFKPLTILVVGCARYMP